jgi:hypothetical protein
LIPRSQDVPAEPGLELGAVVGLDLLYLERKPGQDVVQELDRGLPIRSGIDAQDPQPGAVVDRGVLVEPLLAAGVGGDRFDELDANASVYDRGRMTGAWTSRFLPPACSENRRHGAWLAMSRARNRESAGPDQQVRM